MAVAVSTAAVLTVVARAITTVGRSNPSGQADRSSSMVKVWSFHCSNNSGKMVPYRHVELMHCHVFHP